MKTLVQDLTDSMNNAATKKTARSEQLAEAATSGTESGRLTSLVNSIAEAEGEESAYGRLLMAARYATDQGTDIRAEVNRAAMNILYVGADDTSSGRGNDAKRARFDGKCEAVRELEYMPHR